MAGQTGGSSGIHRRADGRKLRPASPRAPTTTFAPFSAKRRGGGLAGSAGRSHDDDQVICNLFQIHWVSFPARPLRRLTRVTPRATCDPEVPGKALDNLECEMSVEKASKGLQGRS